MPSSPIQKHLATFLGTLTTDRLSELIEVLGYADQGEVSVDDVDGGVDVLLRAQRDDPEGFVAQLRPEEHIRLVDIPSGPGDDSVAEDTLGSMDKGLSQQHLESHLWEAANILRGKIDSSDFKHYIFGLLFYKRLNDVWEEEFRKRFEKDGDGDYAASPENRDYDLPLGVLWPSVCWASDRLGDRLNRAFRVIEEKNLQLQGLFQGVDFDNQDRFPESTLERLLRHFERHRLSHADVQADVLGDAYEYLIARFADDAGKKGGEFYTPKEVVRLLVDCVAPDEGMGVYDPACGSGGLLLEAVNHLRRHGKDALTLGLYGQEMNLNTWSICRMNLFLHGVSNASVLRGDTLRDPLHLDGDGQLLRFDRVLANPPFSLSSWGHEAWEGGDRYGRDKYGIPPRQYGDMAFVQHMLASLTDAGRMGVVLPLGFGFREGQEEEMRIGMVRDDLIEAIIGLPPNLFYGTGIPTCLVIMCRRKPAERQGKILFIDGSREFVPSKNQNRLSDDNIDRLAALFHAFVDEPSVAKVVDFETLEESEFDLTIDRYLPPDSAFEAIDVEEEWQRIQEIHTTLEAHDADLWQRLKDLGFSDIDP